MPEDHDSIRTWQESVWGPVQGVRPPMMRALNEVAEACIACGIEEEDAVSRLRLEYARQRAKGSGEDLGNLPSELAGIVVVLHRVAAAAGADLDAAVEAEMAKNRTRTKFAGGCG